MQLVLGIIIGVTILAIVVALYGALIIAGRSDEQAKMENNKGDDDDMFFRKQICPRCKTGKYTYDLDPKSETCPYIGCWRRNKCHFYKPLDKTSQRGFLNRILNKESDKT